MSNLDSKKNKHMSLDDRIEIQACLDHAMTFKAIARRIGKDQTTVSKEIKKHITVNPGEPSKITDSKGTPVAMQPCPQLLKAPFVCNACKKRRVRCAFQKQLYLAKNAHIEYETLLSESREGIPLNKEKFYEVDSIISKGIKKGQHLYHILETNNLGISQATAYRHLNKGYLSVSRIDFPRVVKFKQRKQYHENYIPKAAKIGRSYDDFLSYIEQHNLSSWVEMDTLIGSIGGKAILTFDFTFCNFMFGLLIDDKTAAEVAQKVRSLKETLSLNSLRFGDIFPLLITDNGGEFANISAFIADVNGEIETALYFCDPYQSCQKPRVEKNHTLFRDIVPNGESFDHFTQKTVNLIFSHVNNVKRKSLNGKSPYEMFAFTYGEKTAALMGISCVPANEVIQSSKLLKTHS
jgi:IS30 family transposase